MSKQMAEALELAKKFIQNGVELGYIQMPDPETPDPAHETLPKIIAALEAYKARKVLDEIGANIDTHTKHQMNYEKIKEAVFKVDQKAANALDDLRHLHGCLCETPYLDSLFRWSDSPQGHAYWANVAARIDDSKPRSTGFAR